MRAEEFPIPDPTPMLLVLASVGAMLKLGSCLQLLRLIAGWNPFSEIISTAVCSPLPSRLGARPKHIWQPLARVATSQVVLSKKQFE